MGVIQMLFLTVSFTNLTNLKYLPLSKIPTLAYETELTNSQKILYKIINANSQ